MNTSKEKIYVKKLKESKSKYIGVSLLFFSIFAVVMLAIGLLLKNKAYIETMYPVQIGVFILGILSFLVYKLLTRKIDSDIKCLSFRKETVNIKQVIENDDVEPGSGVLYIPLLGDLFPKLWGQKMTQIKRYFMITDKQVKHEIESEDYESLSNSSKCHFVYGKQSNVLVGIEL